MIKELVIFGTGIYTGVYIAQNYQAAVQVLCKKSPQECDNTLDELEDEKVEDPKVLFEKAQAFFKSKFGEISDKDGKKGGKEC